MLTPNQLGTYLEHQSKVLLEKSLSSKGEVAQLLWLWSLDIGLCSKVLKNVDPNAPAQDISALVEQVSQAEAQIKKALELVV